MQIGDREILEGNITWKVNKVNEEEDNWYTTAMNLHTQENNWWCYAYKVKNETDNLFV